MNMIKKITDKITTKSGTTEKKCKSPPTVYIKGECVNNQSFNLRLPKQNQQTGPELSILLRNVKKQKPPAILSSSAHAGSTNTGQFSDEDFMDDGQVEAFHAYRAAGK